jgi:hypothetical protein
MPKAQGDLDALCGLYAIANAFDICGFPRFRDVIKESCNALAESRWPATLWEGTSFSDLQRMIKRCRAEIDGLEGVEVKYPFSKSTPTTNDEYWNRFGEFFEGNDATRCAIIRTFKPENHWIVAIPDGGRIAFIDSTAGNSSFRKNLSTLHAGERRKHPQNWLIDRRELVLFSLPQ